MVKQHFLLKPGQSDRVLSLHRQRTEETEMITLITWEHESSKPEVREFETVAACYNLAANGGFYKAQIVNEFGVVDYEF